MENTILNITEAVQLAALGPCIFITLYLFFSARDKLLVLIPILFFISLTCSFLLPVLFLFPDINSETVRAFLIFNEHLAPELSFLLILQFLFQRPPPWGYWLILFLPLVGGWKMLTLSMSPDDVCFIADYCIEPEKLMGLYRVIGSSFVFMLLLPIMKRLKITDKNEVERKNKYWLIIMLIMYNLLVLGVDLAAINDSLNHEDEIFIKTMLGVGFVYLVLSSVFRVFNQNLKIKPLPSSELSQNDLKLIDKINKLLNEDKIYHNMGFNRGVLSDELGLTEQHLSRLINGHYKRTFSELINEYRVSDAKDMLENTKDPITNISFDIGFSSITSFNRVFKEATNLAPSEYRNQNKDKTNKS